jgi:organic hydroperoxide reductase OsmC/OhrA
MWNRQMEKIMSATPDSHEFSAALRWPADPAQAKPPEANFSRNNILLTEGKAEIPGSAPSIYGGDASRYNPEELLIMALAHCHMLTYLAIAAKKRMTVLAYEDRATGTLGPGEAGGRGKMSMREVILRPRVTVSKGSDLAEAIAIHEKAHANCFIASSVNFPVRHEPEIIEA